MKYRAIRFLAYTMTLLIAMAGFPPIGLAETNGENLALGCTATSSSYDEHHIATNAVDGDPQTRWASKAVDDSWITVDLGESCQVLSVTLVWEAAFAEAYALQVSGDGVNWTDAYTTDQGRGGTETIPLSVRTRYIRMQGITRTFVGGVKYGYSLYEFQVHGLRPKSDKSDLTKALAHDIKEFLYTEETLTVYRQALEHAKEVEADIEATADQVLQALTALLEARSQLAVRDLGEKLGQFTGGKTVTASRSALDIGTLQADTPIDLYGRDLTQVYLLFTVTLTNPSGKPDEEIFNTGMIRLQSSEAGDRGGQFVFSLYNMNFGFHEGENVLYFPLIDVSKGYGRPEGGDFDWHNFNQFRMYIDSMGGEEGPFSMTISDIVVWDVSEAEPESDVIPGDVDGNGYVESADALTALQGATKKVTLTTEQQSAADINQNGHVDSEDALTILQIATKKIVV